MNPFSSVAHLSLDFIPLPVPLSYSIATLQIENNQNLLIAAMGFATLSIILSTAASLAFASPLHSRNDAIYQSTHVRFQIRQSNGLPAAGPFAGCYLSRPLLVLKQYRAPSPYFCHGRRILLQLSTIGGHCQQLICL